MYIYMHTYMHIYIYMYICIYIYKTNLKKTKVETCLNQLKFIDYPKIKYG